MWKYGLINDMNTPEKVIYSDDLIVVIKDKFPKATHHFLILPHKEISSITCVTKNDVALLKHMDRKGRDIAAQYTRIQPLTYKGRQPFRYRGRQSSTYRSRQSSTYGSGQSFKIGYHAVPSLERLHLHVISDDLVSPCMKRTKHWNSFTTPLFLHSKDVIRQLSTTGKIQIPPMSELAMWMEAPLKCHKCNFVPYSFPLLKKHLLIHLN